MQQEHSHVTGRPNSEETVVYSFTVSLNATHLKNELFLKGIWYVLFFDTLGLNGEIYGSRQAFTPISQQTDMFYKQRNI